MHLFNLVHPYGFRKQGMFTIFYIFYPSFYPYNTSQFIFCHLFTELRWVVHHMPLDNLRKGLENRVLLPLFPPFFYGFFDAQMLRPQYYQFFVQPRLMPQVSSLSRMKIFNILSFTKLTYSLLRLKFGKLFLLLQTMSDFQCLLNHTPYILIYILVTY